jgi:hypothetical protein
VRDLHSIKQDELPATRAEQAKLGHFDWAEWKSYRDEGRS